MTRREQLEEQYENALFALLMNDLAYTEGARALAKNEELKDNADFQVPPDVQRRCIKTINRCFARNSIYTAKKITCRLLGKIAIIVLIAVCLFTTAFAVSPNFRIGTLNLLIDTFDNRTELSFSNQGVANITLADNINVSTGWLPEGCILEKHQTDAFTIRNTYKTDDGTEILILVLKGDNSMLGINTENANTQKLEINGEEALMILTDDIVQLDWADSDLGLFVIIESAQSQKDSLVKIANNIKIS